MGDCKKKNHFCSVDSGTCKECSECKFESDGIGGNCGKCTPTLECESDDRCAAKTDYKLQYCQPSSNPILSTGKKCVSCDECDCKEDYKSGKSCGTKCKERDDYCEHQNEMIDLGRTEWTKAGFCRDGHFKKLPQPNQGICAPYQCSEDECYQLCQDYNSQNSDYKYCFYKESNKKCVISEGFEARDGTSWLYREVVM